MVYYTTLFKYKYTDTEIKLLKFWKFASFIEAIQCLHYNNELKNSYKTERINYFKTKLSV